MTHDTRDQTVPEEWIQISLKTKPTIRYLYISEEEFVAFHNRAISIHVGENRQAHKQIEDREADRWTDRQEDRSLDVELGHCSR